MCWFAFLILRQYFTTNNKLPGKKTPLTWETTPSKGWLSVKRECSSNKSKQIWWYEMNSHSIILFTTHAIWEFSSNMICSLLISSAWTPFLVSQSHRILHLLNENKSYLTSTQRWNNNAKTVVIQKTVFIHLIYSIWW